MKFVIYLCIQEANCVVSFCFSAAFYLSHSKAAIFIWLSRWQSPKLKTRLPVVTPCSKCDWAWHVAEPRARARMLRFAQHARCSDAWNTQQVKRYALMLDARMLGILSRLSKALLRRVGYLLHSKFKKPEQTLIDVPTPPVLKTSTEPKRDILKCSKNFYRIIYKWLKIIWKI